MSQDRALQDAIHSLLLEAVSNITALCQDKLQYELQFSVQAVVDLTIDEKHIVSLKYKETVDNTSTKNTALKRSRTAENDIVNHEVQQCDLKQEPSEYSSHSDKEFEEIFHGSKTANCNRTEMVIKEEECDDDDDNEEEVEEADECCLEMDESIKEECDKEDDNNQSECLGQISCLHSEKQSHDMIQISPCIDVNQTQPSEIVRTTHDEHVSIDGSEVIPLEINTSVNQGPDVNNNKVSRSLVTNDSMIIRKSDIAH